MGTDPKTAKADLTFAKIRNLLESVANNDLAPHDKTAFMLFGTL